jgi:glycosyltransferase involved in cell wall biosynthesis
MNKKHILMVIGQYYPIIGGTENQARKLACRLKCLGIDVEILTIHRKGLKTYELIDSIPVHRVRGLFYKAIKVYSVMVSIAWFIFKNRHKYDIIHIHQGLFHSFSAVVASKLSGIPSIIKIANSAHKFDLQMLERRFIAGKYFTRFIADNTTKFIAIAPNIINELKAFDIEDSRIQVIANGVDIKTDHISKTISDTLQLIVVARLNSQKNLPFLFHALKDFRFDYNLRIFGEGPLKQQLVKEISDLGLNSKIQLMGKVESNVIYENLSHADFFLLPSITEGLSNALLEAMSIGVIPIVSDIPGNRYALGDDLSRMLALKLQAQVWLDKLAEIITDKEKYTLLKNKCIERAQFFELSNVAQQYVDLYLRLSREFS